MKITYANKKMEKVCTDAKIADRTYGKNMSYKIFQCIGQIIAADTVEFLIEHHISRCHPLSQNRKGQYAMDLEQPYRLVFEKKGKDIQIVNILEITNYH